MEEYVVLVDEKDQEIGTCLKSEVHGAETPLHRAFSFFLFNSKGELLLQQRALHKITWPGAWANSCCGHPMPNESYKDAVKRRVKYELGLEVEPIEMLPDYRYKATKDGVMENEICPVWVGLTNEQPSPNPEEVASTKWANWENLDTSNLAIWTQEEVELLKQSSRMNEFLSTLQ